MGYYRFALDRVNGSGGRRLPPPTWMSKPLAAEIETHYWSEDYCLKQGAGVEDSRDFRMLLQVIFDLPTTTETRILVLSCAHISGLSMEWDAI